MIDERTETGIPVPPSRTLQTAADLIRAAVSCLVRIGLFLTFCVLAACVLWAAEYHAKNGALPDWAVFWQVVSLTLCF